MAYTPKMYSLSSVFLTPISENKSPVVSGPTTPRPLPSLAILLSPIETPKCSSVKDAPDVLTGLIEAGTPRSADLILAHLSPLDIIACMRVSQKWHEIFTSRKNIMDKIIARKSMNKPFSNQTLPSRQPLSSISSNIQHRTSNPAPSFAPLPPKSSHHRPCPQCQSPAKQLNFKRAECTKCKLDFCLNCFDQWHEGECQTIRSPKRPTRSSAIAGTQMCKKRLRRL